MGKIKIGQLGVCHEHAAGKIKTLRSMPDVFEIVGVVDDRDTSAANFVGDTFHLYDGLPFITEEELFNTPDLQAVAVEVPNLELVPAALRCMEQDVAIHMDKPGGDDLELFARMRKGCEDRNLPFQMGYMFRNNPAIQLCIKAVREGWLGDVFELQMCMSHSYGGDRYQQYLGNFKGGIMFNLGCHMIDAIVAMLGRPEKVTPFLKTLLGYDCKIKNNCLAVLEYSGAVITIRACSREIEGQNRRSFKLCGTKGTIDFCPLERFDGQPFKIRMTLLEDNEEYTAGTHIIDFGVIRDRYEDQLLELVKMIKGEIENPYTYKHDYLVQEVLLAAAGYTKWEK